MKCSYLMDVLTSTLWLINLNWLTSLFALVGIICNTVFDISKLFISSWTGKSWQHKPDRSTCTLHTFIFFSFSQFFFSSFGQMLKPFSFGQMLKTMSIVVNSYQTRLLSDYVKKHMATSFYELHVTCLCEKYSTTYYNRKAAKSVHLRRKREWQA